MSRALVAVLTAYRRWVSPMFAPHCRFTPSCSAYAIEAVQTHGAIRGSVMAARRLAKCQPFFTGGHDPVPPMRPRGAAR